MGVGGGCEREENQPGTEVWRPREPRNLRIHRSTHCCQSIPEGGGPRLQVGGIWTRLLIAHISCIATPYVTYCTLGRGELDIIGSGGGLHTGYVYRYNNTSQYCGLRYCPVYYFLYAVTPQWGVEGILRQNVA